MVSPCTTIRKLTVKSSRCMPSGPGWHIWKSGVSPKISFRFRGLNIAHLEMVNILVATKMFCQQWSKKSVQIFCDNSAVVWVLQSGRTKDPYLAPCARNIWLWAANFDINFVFSHIRGKSNCIADLLSRWSYTSDNYVALKQLVPNFHWHDLPLDMLELDNDI